MIVDGGAKNLGRAIGLILALSLGGLGVSARAETVTSVSQYAYDAAGRPTCAAVRMNPAVFGALPADACVLGPPGADGPDRITRTSYDAAYRVTQVTSGYGASGAYASRIEKTVTYTPNGQEQTVADGKGNLTTYEYDGFDRLSKVRYPNATCCASSTTDYDLYSYDAADNRVGWRKRSGEIITTTFDALNRVTYHDGVPTWVYYNNLGQPTYTYAGASAEKVIAHYYDGLGRPSYTYDYRDGAWYPTYTGYDLAGRRTTLQWSDGLYVNYDYNLAGEVVAVRENGSFYLDTFAYDNLGRRTAHYRANSAQTYYGYDAASRLSSLTHDLPGTAQDQVWTYAYTAASQVKTWTSSNSAYNWTPGPAVDRGYTINGLNQMTSVGPAGTSGTPITYDGRGNLNSDGATSFIYDIDNHLISASGASSTTLSYDPLGRLGQIAATTATTRFVYSGSDLIAELNTSNAIVRRYVPGPGTDEPLVWYEGSGVGDRRWLLPDAQGSIVAVTGASGPATINTYDEYGVPAAGNVGRYQYTGQTWLPEVGLYNYKARVYSPTLGRFLQTDPIGYDDGLNMYAYVGNDPLNKVDPDGQIAETIWDLANVAMGAASLTDNVRNGRWGAATVDGLGLVIDGAATVIPVVPGGAGATIRAVRGAERAAEVARIASRPRQIEAAWSASTYRHGGLMTGIEHIMYRHGAKSGFENVSKFANGTSARDVKSLVDSALRNGAVTATGKGAYTVEYNASRVIGTAADGAKASHLRVHVRDGVIQTAFPY